jgi:hypothetical protein
MYSGICNSVDVLTVPCVTPLCLPPPQTECSAKELVDIQCEAIAELVTEKQLHLRRIQQADEVTKLKKKQAGMFGRLKSEAVAWAAVPYACTRDLGADVALPSTPVPDTGDLKTGSKPLASAEWRSALLSHEGKPIFPLSTAVMLPW